LHVVKGGKQHHGQGRPVYWPQDAIRRAADAMRESRSNDLYILAKIALHAAIRNRDDLLDLDPAPSRAPAKPASIEAMAPA
jgi:hypothetical protein